MAAHDGLGARHRTTAVLVVAVVLAAMLVAGAGAQSCVPFTGAPRTGHKCDSLVSYPSFLLLPSQSYDQVLSRPHPLSSFIIPFIPFIFHNAGAHWYRTRIALTIYRIII
jgi:hypothetical protein